MKKASDAITRADDYCKRIRNRVWVILPEADNIRLTIVEGKDSLGRPKKQEYSLAFLIAKRMTEYQSVRDSSSINALPQKSSDPELRLIAYHARRITNSLLNDRALDLLEMIDQAHTHRVIKEENLAKQLEELQHENELLKEKVDKLEKENEKLHDSLKKFGKVGFVSDVSDNKEE